MFDTAIAPEVLYMKKAVAFPQVLHLTSRSKELEHDTREFFKIARSTHPGWEMRLNDDEDNARLVGKHYPGLERAFHSLPCGVMRSDVARLLYMHRYGGWYCDTDYEFLRPLEEFEPRAPIALPICRNERTPELDYRLIVLGNAIFGSEPGQDFWIEAAEAALSQRFPSHYDRKNIIQDTGPLFLTDFYFSHLGRYHAELPERDRFHPDLVGLDRNALLRNGTVGIHHCVGSWIPSNLGAKVKRKIVDKVRMLSSKVQAPLLSAARKDLQQSANELQRR